MANARRAIGRTRALAIGFVFVALSAAACSGDGDADEGGDGALGETAGGDAATREMTVRALWVPEAGEEKDCSSPDAEALVGAGFTVATKDATAIEWTEVASGTFEGSPTADLDEGGCVVEGTVEVPDEPTQYLISSDEIESGGGAVLNRSDLEAADWTVLVNPPPPALP